MQFITGKQKLRIMERSTKTQGGCLEWQGAKTTGGYGIARVGSRSDGTYRTVLAHRASYFINKGDIPEGMIVCHICDNPSCINPDHLFVGSYKDNVDDMDRKGRRVNPERPSGEKNYNSTLSWRAVDEIRASDLSCRKLADIHGVSKTQVSRIKSGKAWSCRKPQELQELTK